MGGTDGVNEIEQVTTRQRQSNRRREAMLETALQLFCEKGVEETAIEDVAKAAGVGPATVYRYFDTKTELAIQSAIRYWEKISGKYLPLLQMEHYRTQTGYQQMEQILGIFTSIFETEFPFLRFLQEFDIMVQKSKLSWERLEAYEACILALKPYVTNALRKGESDGTLTLPGTVEETYFIITHTMLALMQKLAFGGRLLPSDERVALEKQVQLTCRLLLRGLCRVDLE